MIKYFTQIYACLCMFPRKKFTLTPKICCNSLKHSWSLVSAWQKIILRCFNPQLVVGFCSWWYLLIKFSFIIIFNSLVKTVRKSLCKYLCNASTSTMLLLSYYTLLLIRFCRLIEDRTSLFRPETTVTKHLMMFIYKVFFNNYWTSTFCFFFQ